MKKSREQLEKERDKAIAKREQYQHRQRRLENRVRYYTEGERKNETTGLSSVGPMWKALPRR